MRYALLLLALLGSCNSLPWITTDKELERALQTNSHEDQSFALKGDASIVGAARSEGVPLAAYIPPEAVPLPPPLPPGTDWGEIAMLAITALTGGAGAIGYRALDHRRKRKNGKPAAQPTA